jgi:hypothetical protein
MTYFMEILLTLWKRLLAQINWEVRSDILARGSTKKTVTNTALVNRWLSQPLLQL